MGKSARVPGGGEAAGAANGSAVGSADGATGDAAPRATRTGRGDDRAAGDVARALIHDGDLAKRLAAHAATIVGASDADDVVQEALLRIALSRAPLRDVARGEAWAFRIVRHAAIDLLRMRRVRVHLWAPLPESHDDWACGAPEDDGQPDGGLRDGGLHDGGLHDDGLPDDGLPDDALPDGAHPGGGAWTLASRLVAGGVGDDLPAHQRLLLALHALKDAPQARLCAATGLAAPALRVRLFRARRALSAGRSSRRVSPG